MSGITNALGLGPAVCIDPANKARAIEPARALAAEALSLEQEVSNLVNEAYGLTPEEVAVMWQTAPPRMPISTTQQSQDE